MKVDSKVSPDGAYEQLIKLTERYTKVVSLQSLLSSLRLKRVGQNLLVFVNP